ncbi:hypothetical protein [Ligilactobacillus ruminis]|uniref:hypothetical protein n=1 Tax=Ligilactobacillus ruminis TaxID=1623 RepID=UPI0022E6A8B0|nr:hypothetical protein [Ligilactobacillus ruminis]
MFKITCAAYCINPRNQHGEYREIKPHFLKNKSGFFNAVEIKARALSAAKNGVINVWTEHNETQVPDISVNADDMLAIKLIEEEEE